MINNKTLSILALFLLSLFSSKAEKVYEIPFIVNAKGQILVQAHLNNHAEPKIFMISTTNRSIIRKDKRPDLFAMKIDTSSIKLRLESLTFPGGFKLNKVKLDWKNMSNRDTETYGDHIYGIIGPSILRHYICQFNFATKRLRITFDTKSLNIPDNAYSSSFSSSFMNWYPSIEVYCDKIGKREVFLDINSLLTINIHEEGIRLKYTETEMLTSGSHLSSSIHGALFDDVRINDIKVGKSFISISDDYPAVVGLGLLRNYIVTIDFVDKILYMEPIITNKK